MPALSSTPNNIRQSSPPLSPSLPTLTHTGRPKRNYRLPLRFHDKLPVPPNPIQPQPHVVWRIILHVHDSFRSTLNEFRVLREYQHQPSYDPDTHLKPEELANYPTPPSIDLTIDRAHNSPPPPWPFENMSKYLLMNWFYSGGGQKSEGEVDRLAQDVISSPDFKPGDLTGFSIRQENKRLDANIPEGSSTPFSGDDWHEASVEIEVPVPVKNSPSCTYRVPGFHYRSIVEIIKATWSRAPFLQYHITPFKRIYVDSKGTETRIYDELYTSDAFDIAHDNLQKQSSEPGCKLEKIIAALMFWSDSMHLTNFGTVKVWPLYMYFGNLSKYTRAKPSSSACHHLAYIPSVCFTGSIPYFQSHMLIPQIPDALQDFLSTFILKATQRKRLLTHC